MSGKRYYKKKDDSKKDYYKVDEKEKNDGEMSKMLKYNESKKGIPQSKLSESQIKERLVGFTRLKDNSNAPELLSNGMLVRYFAVDKDGKNKNFRMGGSITKIDDAARYLILKGLKSFSVSLQKTKDRGAPIIYYKNPADEGIHLRNIIKKYEGNPEEMEKLILFMGGKKWRENLTSLENHGILSLNMLLGSIHNTYSFVNDEESKKLIKKLEKYGIKNMSEFLELIKKHSKKTKKTKETKE